MAQSVFNKILGKKDKGLDIFNIPEKKYHHDIKKLSKMEKKQLIDQIQMMEKHISTLTHKLEQGRKQHEKINQKYQECSQKLNVLNSKMAMISNEHEQLQVKFSNLQSSLQYMTKEKQAMFKSQLQFIQSKQLIKDKINDLATVLKVYREQVTLTDKIAYQNKQLKIKYSKLQQDFFNLSQKVGQSKGKSHNEGAGIETNHSNTVQQGQQQQKNQYKLILQTKQQMIILLNKKINQHKQKKNELEQTINQLYHQIHTKQIQSKQKQQQTNRYIHQCTEYKKKISNMKENSDNVRNILQANKEQLRKKIQEVERLQNQLVQVRNQLKLNKEQRRILISHSQNLAKNQVNSKEVQLEINRLKSQLEGKVRDIEVLNRSISTLEEQKLEDQNKINELRLIERQNNELKQSMQEQSKKNEQLRKKIQNMEQNYQIKLKKLEFTSNQQRIKAQSLKRSLTNLQVKDQQNRKQLDEMYEKKMFQDNKYAKMQGKLKQYKQIIQYLRKQKVELEKTFQNKIRNMEEVVLHEVEEQDRNQHEQLSDRNQRIQHEYIEGNDAIISKMKSKIVDLEQQIMFLKEQNKILNSQKGDLEESNLELERSFKVMSQKRQQVMKQIKKLSSSSVGFGNISSQRAPREELTTSQGGMQRQKRIAQKALKGFDILSKLLTTLYKQFIQIHMSDIARKQIKQLEGNINILVNKCQDMKDIFQGYL